MKKVRVSMPEIMPNWVNRHQLLKAVVFFCGDVFEKYDAFYSKAVLFVNAKKDGNRQGCFYVCNLNELRFSVNLDVIEECVKDGISYKSFIKSLLLVILHEIGHGVYLLGNYSRQDHKDGYTLENYHDDDNEEIGKLIKKIKEKNKGFSMMEVSRQIPEEIFADRFAFSNLSYMENLYEFGGLLLPLSD